MGDSTSWLSLPTILLAIKNYNKRSKKIALVSSAKSQGYFHRICKGIPSKSFEIMMKLQPCTQFKPNNFPIFMSAKLRERLFPFTSMGWIVEFIYWLHEISLTLYFCSCFRTKDATELRRLLRLMRCWSLLILWPKVVVHMFLVLCLCLCL